MRFLNKAKKKGRKKTLIVHTEEKASLVQSDALRVVSVWKTSFKLNKKDKLYGASARAKQTDCCVLSLIQHKRDRVQEPSHCHSTLALNLSIPNIYTQWSLGLRALLELRHIFYNVLTFCNAQQIQKTEDFWMRLKTNSHEFKVMSCFLFLCISLVPMTYGNTGIHFRAIRFCIMSNHIVCICGIVCSSGFYTCLSSYPSLTLLSVVDCNHIVQ